MPPYNMYIITLFAYMQQQNTENVYLFSLIRLNMLTHFVYFAKIKLSHKRDLKEGIWLILIN